MSIFNALTLFGGLALFLFGMNIMGEGLEKQAGGKLKAILEKLTSNPLKGVFLGLCVTAVIQSSSATTVMVVGFVNSGIMRLSQAISVIMGANIGTTVTAWILSLTGIQSDSIFLQLLKPSAFSPILAVIGIALYMFAKSTRKKDTGTILLGFATLMFGMEAMSGAVKPLAEVPEFTQLFVAFSNPILGVLVGALLTAVIQSSSASVGILQALSATGSVTYASAIPIIMGQNIGTCVTALLSSVGTNKNARRAAMVHLYFNIIGTVLFLSLFYLLKAVIGFPFIDDPVNQAGIAVVHTAFNLLSTMALLPFTKLLEKLAYLTIRDTGTDSSSEFQLLDERFLATPSFAVQQCKAMTEKMASYTQNALDTAISMLKGYDFHLFTAVSEAEQKADGYEDMLGTYLVKLAGRSMSQEDSKEVSKLLHCIGDFERISDHALNIAESAQEIHEKKTAFSKSMEAELEILQKAVREIVSLTFSAFQKNDLALAARVEPLEQVIDLLKVQIKARHIERLQNGACTTLAGFILSDLITNYERIADHCSNIAVCVIEVEQDSFDTHEYLNSVKTSGNTDYLRYYETYKADYALPATASV